MKHSSPILSTICSGEEESVELEWLSHLSPHISTLSSKDSSGGSDSASRVSTGSESYTETSPSSNSSSNGDSTCIDHDCDCHPSSSPSTPRTTIEDEDDPIISFQGLSLQQDQPLTETSTSKSAVIEEDENEEVVGIRSPSSPSSPSSSVLYPVVEMKTPPTTTRREYRQEQQQPKCPNLSTSITSGRRRPMISRFEPKTIAHQNKSLSSSLLSWDVVGRTTSSSSSLSSGAATVAAAVSINGTTSRTNANRLTFNRIIRTTPKSNTSNSTCTSDDNNDDDSIAGISEQQQQPQHKQRSSSKRQRGGSDFSMIMMTTTDQNTAVSGTTTDNATAAVSSPFDHRKRRRLNRNRALLSHEFDTILSQINTTGSL